ncbi:MAG: hypothetical protein AAF757_02820 [Cyanobacteria bacterium P01_D01_bin.116]
MPFPLNATASTIIPANKIPRRSHMEQAANYSSSFARFSPMYTSFTGGKESSEFLRNTLLFQGIGAVAGYFSPRFEKFPIQIVQMPIILTIKNRSAKSWYSKLPYLENIGVQKAGIQSYPTWRIKGKTYMGAQSLEKLAQVSGYKGLSNFKYYLHN